MVAAKGRPAPRLRSTRAKIRIMGAALGTIIATIITAHMAHMSRPSVALHACIAIMAPSPAPMAPPVSRAMSMR